MADLCPGSMERAYYNSPLNLYECPDEDCLACFDPEVMIAGHRTPNHNIGSIGEKHRKRS